MSVQVGVWFFDGRPADQESLLPISDAVAQYGSDGCGHHFLGSVGMIYRPYHTTKESRLESQPHVTSLGKVVMWDGRLDNREELTAELDGHLVSRQTDVDIVAAAYERWGTNSFCKLLGDWALSVWDTTEQTLILARDYMAVRHLYYHMTREKILWCTHLAPIVLLSGTKFTINDEYVAGYIVAHPDAHLTPYREILAVPPAKFVRIRKGEAATHSYWVFEPKRPLRCKTDAEYEEHFRYVFRQAVRRRLRSDSPVLADLSGGFDSTSIVCMADDILAHEGVQTSCIDTISSYDLSEPEGDDFFYFTKVEEKRGRTGFHIDLGAVGLPFSLECSEFVPSPSIQEREDIRLARHKIIQQGGYRVSLSGTGGDEVIGQASDFRVLMGDSMVQFRLGELAGQLKAWSLLMKRPWVQLFVQVFVQLLPLSLRAKVARHARPEPWINREFARRHKLSQRTLGEVGGARFWLPSQRDWAWTLATLARRTAENLPSIEEIRYPYLDRDLVEFLTSVPQDQLLRPGERRSLMRRAFVGLLPPEVLSRRTKAGAGRCYILLMEKSWHDLERILGSLVSARLGFINRAGFHDALYDLKRGNMSFDVVDLLRGLAVELWLRDVARRGVISAPSAELLLGEMATVRS